MKEKFNLLIFVINTIFKNIFIINPFFIFVKSSFVPKSIIFLILIIIIFIVI